MTEKLLTYDQLGVAPANIYEQMGYRDAQPDEATVAETAAIVACHTVQLINQMK